MCGAANHMNDKERIGIYFDSDVARWLDESVPRMKISEFVNNLVRENMGVIHKKRKLEAIVASDAAGSLEAMAELEEIEKLKESADYKLGFLECQLRVLREFERNGRVRDTVRAALMHNLDMTKLECIDFINNTLDDYKSKLIDNQIIRSEIERVRAENNISSDVEGGLLVPVRHGVVDLQEYCPY